jgi:hypothetical protein
MNLPRQHDDYTALSAGLTVSSSSSCRWICCYPNGFAGSIMGASARLLETELVNLFQALRLLVAGMEEEKLRQKETRGR